MHCGGDIGVRVTSLSAGVRSVFNKVNAGQFDF